MPVSLYNLRPPRYPLTSSTNRSSYGNVFHSDSIAQPFMPDHSSGISTTGWHDFKHLEHEISFHCEVISIIFFLQHRGQSPICEPVYIAKLSYYINRSNGSRITSTVKYLVRIHA